MKKSNTDRLMTWDFGRMCVANFLLFASTYMLLPLLPVALCGQAGTSVPQAGMLYLLFCAGMLAVGPLHAYLGDEYKRKGVLQLSLLGMLAAMLGYVYAECMAHVLLLALVQGACFGLAATAGITVAIDITPSARRSAGNQAYAWSARLGLLAGVVAGTCCYRLWDFHTVIYAAIACGLLCLLVASQVYVAFRAPIGVPLFNIDRFLLLRGWLPALNMVLLAYVPGLLLPLLLQGDYAGVAGVAVLLFLTVSFTKMFVRLSHHCQRGTANTTCHLAMETGLLLGMFTTCHLPALYPLVAPDTVAYPLAAGIALFAFLLLTPTYLYYKKKKVR